MRGWAQCGRSGPSAPIFHSQLFVPILYTRHMQQHVLPFFDMYFGNSEPHNVVLQIFSSTWWDFINNQDLGRQLFPALSELHSAPTRRCFIIYYTWSYPKSSINLDELVFNMRQGWWMQYTQPVWPSRLRDSLILLNSAPRLSSCLLYT